MFLTVKKFKSRANELGSRRYCNMQNIAPLTCMDDTLGNDEVHKYIPKELYGSDNTINIGDHFIGRDRYMWLYKQVDIPAQKEGYETVGLFDFGWTGGGNNCGFESLLYVDGKPYQGVDENHKDVVFTDLSGKNVKLVFLLWTGLEGGGIPTEIEHKIKSVSLGYLHRDTDKLFYYTRCIAEAVEYLEDTPIKHKVIKMLDSALDLINWDDDKFYNTVTPAVEQLERDMAAIKSDSDVTVNCVGHTHIDVAWLWRLKHTREKAMRSFSTVNRLMEEFDEYKFLQTQPQLYKYIKNDCPEVYEYIKKRVKEGKWEADGGMWLEADCNVTSGESLARQLIHGTRFIKEEFDKDCEFLWLPDVFGYSWALPQILKLCNIKTFMTTKISWNQYNTMPNDLFKWRGMDGSEILTYFVNTPNWGDDIYSRFSTYNGLICPHAIMGSYKKFRNKDISPETLVSYGYGDGGGGVNRDMLKMRRAMDKIPGLPNVKTSTAKEFFDKLHSYCENTDGYLATWDGELYLEYHRGTYTTQAYNKKMNRHLEYELAKAEWLSAISMLNGGEYNQNALYSGWETVLRNQFHDIIPGSSINEVYKDCHKEYGEVEDAVKEVKDSALKVLSVPQENVFSIINFCGFSGVSYVFIKTDAKGCFKDESGNILPCQKVDNGYVVQMFAKPLSVENIYFMPCTCSDVEVTSVMGINSADTPYYSVEWDDNGNLVSIFDKANSRQVLSAPSNVLEIFEDKPNNYDAWDIDIFYTRKKEIAQFVGCEPVENGPVRTVIRFNYKYNKSTFTQNMILYRSNPRIDFETKVDWQESHRLLKVAFNVDVRSTKATYDVQYGHVERPTHFNTSWDYARFEVVGHKWADLSDASYGVSLLNDCKYGYSIKDNKMSITLLKSSKHPDYAADMGEHSFTYSLLPHNMSVAMSDTIAQSNLLNLKPVAVSGKCDVKQLVRIDSENVCVDAVKKAYDSDEIVVRLHECRGGKTKVNITSEYEVDSWCECNLLEQPVSDMAKGEICLEFKPFEIKNIKLKIK
ncbi:MAG: alpha-mannosidase [Clostridia bacterium]|nr:alpha-mannosidase [Clostridia bacterium]